MHAADTHAAHVSTDLRCSRCLCVCLCVQKTLKERYKLIKFFPFNPVDKYTCATLEDLQTGDKFRVLKGSPQVRRRTHATQLAATRVWACSVRTYIAYMCL